MADNPLDRIAKSVAAMKTSALVKARNTTASALERQAFALALIRRQSRG